MIADWRPKVSSSGFRVPSEHLSEQNLSPKHTLDSKL